MPYKDPAKRREASRISQQRRRDRMRNPGPGRPPKHGRPKRTVPNGTVYAGAAPAQPVNIEAPDFDAIAVMSVEKQRKILTWVAEHPETRPGDRTRAISTLADLERKDGKVDDRGESVDPRLVDIWKTPHGRMMWEELTS